MLDRRSLVTNGGTAAFGALALAAVTSGASAAEAVPAGHNPWAPLPDPATTPVPNPPFPGNLTREERRNLETFDELDFDVFTHRKDNKPGVLLTLPDWSAPMFTRRKLAAGPHRPLFVSLEGGWLDPSNTRQPHPRGPR